MRIIVIALLIISIAYAPAYADDSFLRFKALRCKFQETYFTSLDGEKVRTEKNNDMFELAFDAINRSSKKARLIGNIGVEDVSISSANDVLHLLESTPSGNINLVTVYNHSVSKNQFFAVNSRHVGNALIPMVSYMIGSCTPLN